MPKVRKTKVIGRKRYHRKFEYSTKSLAVCRAKELHRSIRGLRCRVVRETGEWGTRAYAIYTR